VIYVLTFGGPGDSTEILSLHIYKTAFVSQRLGSAAAISVLRWWWSRCCRGSR